MAGTNSSGIYAIVNRVNGKRYVGSAVNIKRRWQQHRSLLQNNKHHSSHLQRAWNKHGESNFDFVIVELVLPAFLLDIEQKYLDKNKRGYNLAMCAESPGLGRKYTPEHRAKISAAKKGHATSIETREKLRLAMMQRPPMSQDTRQKISAGGKGRTFSKEAREKMRAASLGKIITTEQRLKISQSKRGVPWSAKRRAAQSTKKCCDE